MALAILAPARITLQAMSHDLANKAKVEIAKLALSAVAAGLLLSAAIVVLAQEVGYPVAAVVFATALGLLALVVHLIGRRQSARQSQRIAGAQNRVQADIDLMTSVARSTRPLLPLVAFIAAFTIARRR